jgi:FkbM family methyltransferase
MNIWIYGAGGFAQRLSKDLHAQGIEVSGFVKENISGNEIQNCHLASEVVSKDDLIIIGVFNHLDDPLIIEDYLNSLGFKNVISPATYMLTYKESNLDTYYLSTNEKNYANENDVERVTKILNDKESVEILKSFVSYQKTGEISHIRRSAEHSIQYLALTLPQKSQDNWFLPKNKWIDVGSFDGDTIQVISNYKSIIDDEFLCIEPDHINYKKLLRKLAQVNASAITLNLAVGADARTINFASSGNSSSSVVSTDEAQQSEETTLQIDLDSVVGAWHPTHIKMDIEGFELQALKGAEKILKRYRPRIVISVYHKPMDIIEIPCYLADLLDNYEWYLRAYGAHGYDTVIYGVPR